MSMNQLLLLPLAALVAVVVIPSEPETPEHAAGRRYLDNWANDNPSGYKPNDDRARRDYEIMRRHNGDYESVADGRRDRYTDVRDPRSSHEPGLRVKHLAKTYSASDLRAKMNDAYQRFVKADRNGRKQEAQWAYQDYKDYRGALSYARR